MAAQLAATVYVSHPDTHQTVELAEGSSPEPRLAALVPNPAAWVDGKLPRLPKTQTDGPTDDGPDDASGANSEASADGDDQAAPAAKKTAASKRAANRPARGRAAADQGDSGE
ncbi:hypothetical protein AB0M00_44060 [Streptomyces chartreusis]|uniref:hypothetical protein n=1 Tax=Streptomyces chartreusis TaxID=1969 RepID=UPI0034236D6D